MIKAFNLWFYLLPDGKLKAWQTTANYSLDPVVAQLSPSVYTNPELLYNATSSGDSNLYNLNKDYRFFFDTSYYDNAVIPNSRWIRSAQPDAMLPLTPFANPILPATTPGVWGRNPSVVFVRGAFGSWDDFSCYNPRIVKNLDGSPFKDFMGYYYMTYNASNSSLTDHDQSGLARTLSLNDNWIRISTTYPILSIGPIGSVDAGDAQVESVLYDGSSFHWFYDANSSTFGSDQVSVGYATGSNILAPIKQGLIVTALPGEDYYGSQIFKQGNGFGMVVTKHIGSIYGVVRLDSPSLSGPWTERPGWAFTHPSGQAFVSSVRVEGGNLRILYSDANFTEVKSALAIGTPLNIGSNPFMDMGALSIPRIGATYPYGCDSVCENNMIHLFFNAQPYTGGIGHAFAPIN